VQGHAPAERRLEHGKRDVAITAAEPAGTYAVRLTFSDGHATGIFTWPYLETLAAEREARWAGYLAELAARGLGRDR
jgi:DUF971 family protein